MSAEADLEATYEAYVVELKQALAEVQQWQRQLAQGEKYNEAGMRIDEIWPSGLASHPRIIAVFRKYWLQAAHIIEDYERREEQEDEEAPREEDWGADDDEEGEMYSGPRDLLLGQLQAQAPELFAHFKQFLFMPIGLDDHVLIDEETGHG